MEKSRAMTPDSHPLKAWIKRHTTPADFAREIGCSVSHLNNLLNRRRRPSLELFDKIEAKTNRRVKAKDFEDARQ